MAATTITLNEEAYQRLKKAKSPGKSFSDVIIKYVQPSGLTAGDLLDDLEPLRGQTFIDEELMREVESGRKRKRNAR